MTAPMIVRVEPPKIEIAPEIADDREDYDEILVDINARLDQIYVLCQDLADALGSISEVIVRLESVEKTLASFDATDLQMAAILKQLDDRTLLVGQQTQWCVNQIHAGLQMFRGMNQGMLGKMMMKGMNNGSQPQGD